jgi:hypothetical protein
MSSEVPDPASREDLERLRGRVAALGLPAAGELPRLTHADATGVLEPLIGKVGRCLGALEVAIGERLAVLEDGLRFARLGRSCLRDLAREDLGRFERDAGEMARLARELRDRPVVRAAVWRGEISPRAARVILPLAVGDAEAPWVETARAQTIRKLEREVARARGSPVAEEDEPVRRLRLAIGPAVGELEEALEAAALIAEDPGMSRARRFEALCMDMRGSLAGRPGDLCADVEEAGASCAEVEELGLEGGCADVELGGPGPAELERDLEASIAAYGWLEALPAVAAPVTGTDEAPVDVYGIRDELRRLVALHAGWDELFGHLALLVRRFRVWRMLGYRSFASYCRARLPLRVRAVEERIALEVRLYELPELRAALARGRVTYEQARHIAEIASEGTVEGWIQRAQEVTSVALKREVREKQDATLRAAGEVELRLPQSVAGLFAEICEELRVEAGAWLSMAECVPILARSFLRTHGEEAQRRRQRMGVVMRRDRMMCQVPGCSRAADDRHHIIPEGRLGPGKAWNLVAICRVHHKHGVHAGSVLVRGRAPELTWVLGEREVAAAMAEHDGEPPPDRPMIVRPEGGRWVASELPTTPT